MIVTSALRMMENDTGTLLTSVITKLTLSSAVYSSVTAVFVRDTVSRISPVTVFDWILLPP